MTTKRALRSITVPIARDAGHALAPRPDREVGKPTPGPKPKPSKGDCGCGGHGKSGDCACGCGSSCDCTCEPTCCALECIERPRFFCGQLLTNQDLDALVGWTRQRLGLARYVDGWGVACGLDVTCSPSSPTSVEIGAGYAIDCCGNDIVVCEPKTLDLSAACADPENPCADLEAWARSQAGKGKAGKRLRVEIDVAIRYHETGSDPQSALAQGPCGQVASCENTRIQEGCELVWTEAEPGSSPVDAEAEHWLEAWKCCCEIVDQFERRFGRALSSRPVDGLDEESDEAEAIRGRIEALRDKLKDASPEARLLIQAEIRELAAALEALREQGKRGGSGGPDTSRLATAIQRFLLGWIDEHPLTQFCFVSDWICEIDDASLVDPRKLAPLLWIIVQDCRNALARCACAPCAETDGVPLARVCLIIGGSKTPCQVLSIDPYPPYRRELGQGLTDECWPAPLGAVNLASIIWRREDDACRKLADRGVPARLPGKPQEMPRTLAELRELCKQSPFADCGEEICLQTIDASELCLGREPRVIGWAPCPIGEEPKPEPKPGPVNVDPRKNGPAEVLSSSGVITYTLGFACDNPNPFPVKLTLVDVLDQRLDYAGDDSGQTPSVNGKKVSWTFDIPATSFLERDWDVAAKFQPVSDTVTVVNNAKVIVRAPDGSDVGSFPTPPVETIILFAGTEPGPVVVVDGLAKDDLTKIKGIAAGRKRVLEAKGIDTFAKLAAMKPELLVEIFPNVAQRFLAKWQDEAKVLTKRTKK